MKGPNRTTCPLCKAQSFEDWRSRAMRSVLSERDAQDKKWGQQNHPPEWWLAILGEEFGEACQAALADKFAKNAVGGEKLCGSLRAEMVQVAAVAVAFIEYLDRGGYNK